MRGTTPRHSRRIGQTLGTNSQQHVEWGAVDRYLLGNRDQRASLSIFNPSATAVTEHIMVALHEFMAQHREELFGLVNDDLQRSAPDGDLAGAVLALIDEMIAALQREAGLHVDSPLPGRSATAKWLGGRRQARGYAISKIAEDIGAISKRLGELGARHGLSFEAKEYQVFNECIDTASASALEEYSSQDREHREEEELERVGLVAHELRNTLAGARMSFAVLQLGEVGVRGKTGQVLDRSLRRLESLVGELVFAVRLRTGLQPELRPLFLTTLVANATDVVVPERNIALKAEVDERVQLQGDEELLSSALGNLLQNAFKFTHPGGTILVRGYREGPSVVLEVEDECGGLPPGKPEELFAPFVSKSVDRRGLGLGLTITRRAIEAHGGQVSVQNLPGKGCIFRATLPADGGLPGA
jgi:signal transduction histidine kinase